MARSKKTAKTTPTKAASPRPATPKSTPAKTSTNRLIVLKDGRQSFASNGMRAPVAKNGPYVGQPFLVKPGKEDRNPISKKVADTSVADILEAWKGGDCTVTKKERLANLKAFFNFVYGFELTGNDAWSVLKVAEKVLPTGFVTLPSRTKTRLDRLNITPKTKGTRGLSLNKVMPSFMWEFLTNNCQHLKQINQFLAGVAKDKYGIDLNKIPDYSSYTVPDSELVNLVEGVDTSGICAENRGWWKRLLVDVNKLHKEKVFDGSDLEAYFHYFTMLTGNRVINPAKFNVDNLKFRPVAVSSSTRKPATAPRVKASLLWYLVDNFCANLPLAVTIMEKLYNITPSTDKTTTAKFIDSEPPKRAPLPYVDETQARKRKTTLAREAGAIDTVKSPKSRSKSKSPKKASPKSPSPKAATPRSASASPKKAPRKLLATKAARAEMDRKDADKAAKKASSPKMASPRSPSAKAATPVDKAKAKAVKAKVSGDKVIPSPVVRGARTASGKKAATPTKATTTATKRTSSKKKAKMTPTKKGPSAGYYYPDGQIRVYFDKAGRAHDFNGAFIKTTTLDDGKVVGIPK